ncbi:DUF2637 domain-containing protein [Streptomyces sp. NPDC003860]
MTPRTTAHDVAPVGPWDRLAILALGTAGCALSYDALQQMAVAIHIRGFLTYLFPLVIDGFIAYGVRALLVLRTAPLRARAYVWLLFGTATTASIWANALHAVRLNQQMTHGGGLRLGDTVVAVLSTLAPLALAGAVHLYILITRHHPGFTATGTERDLGPSRTAGPAHHTGDRPLQPVPGTGTRPNAPPAGDRTLGTGTGPASGTGTAGPRDQARITGVPGAGDRDRVGHPTPETGPEPALPGDRERTVPGAKPQAEGPATPDVPGTEDGDGDRVKAPGPGSGTEVRPRDRADGTRSGAEFDAGPQAHPQERVPDRAVPETGQGRKPAGAGSRNKARPRSVPGTATRPQKGTGGRSRTGQGSRSRFSEDDLVALIHPHVPKVLTRDGNEAITRVQLREIMRDQHISIRNEHLSPVLQRLRAENGTTTTRKTR